MSKNSTNTFISLLLGLIVGGVLGILFAPDKGNNTRDRLTFRLNKYKRKLEELVDEIIDDKATIYEKMLPSIALVVVLVDE